MKSIQTIAIFAEFFPPHLGGIENYVDNVSRILLERGYKVIIVTSQYEADLKEKEVKGNMTIYRYPVHNLFVSRYPIPKKNQAFKQLYKQLESEGIDFAILNTRFFLSTYEGAKFTRKMNIKNFVIEHGCEHLTINNAVLDFFGAQYEHVLTHFVAKRVDAYYGVSKACNEWTSHFNLQSSGILHGAVNIHEEATYPKQLNDGKIIFTFAGRLLKQKGVYDLVESFNELCKTYNQIELHIAGKGDLTTYIEAQSKSNPKIKVLGYLTHDALMKQLAKTDVFVYAPIWPEGLGISVIEAGLMRCATIVSEQKGILEVVPSTEFGLIVNAQHSLQSLMKQYIDDPILRKQLAESLHTRVINEFSWENTVDEIELIIKKGCDYR